ncbi:MAG TPA: class I SAM-dependent methyltransferase [Euzebyales bacterium]|nr:class I SAM-dependent methyltransferase [Euzebyales bacterium]
MITDVAHDWYVGFFTELPNEFWRRAASPEAARADVDFVEGRLGLPHGASILDVPCGSGRHALELAARGHRVTGLDISAEAIAHARRAAAGADLDARFVEADMRAVPAGVAFDAAICMGNSFGYLDPAGTRAFVAALAGAVRPGGGLVIDCAIAAESVLPGLGGSVAPRIMRAGDITVEATNTYDTSRSVLVSHYRFTRGTETVDATALHHVYTSGHIGDLLTEAGFTDIEHYADPDGTPFEVGADRLLVVARRR